MALTSNEVLLCNMAADRIGAGNFTFANQATHVVGAVCNRHYTKLKDALLRSFEWNFAQSRKTLSIIKTLVLNESPDPNPWVVGDTITGLSSGATATILTVISDSEYELSGISGILSDSETITNATVEKVYYHGELVTYGVETVYSYDSTDTDQIVCQSGYPLVTDKIPDFEWDFQYLLPTDYKRLISVFEDEGTDSPNARYHIEGNRILTNYDTLNIRYIKNVTDPDDFDDLFHNILVLRVAMRLISPTAGTKTNDLKAELMEELKTSENKARTINAQENNTSGRLDYNLARYGI